MRADHPGVNSSSICKFVNRFLKCLLPFCQTDLSYFFENSGHVEAAIKSYKQALQLRADFPEATCNLLHTLQASCCKIRAGYIYLCNHHQTWIECIENTGSKNEGLACQILRYLG